MPDSHAIASTATDPSFSTILPTLQLAWSGHSLGLAENCLRQYELARIHNYALPGETPADLRFGIEVHSAFEAYENERAKGSTHKESLRAAIRSALTSTWDSELDRPWDSGDTLKNRDSLIRTIVDYYDNFENDPLETVRLSSTAAAVERTFELELDKTSVTGERYRLHGRKDRLVRFQDRYWTLDYKTTRKTLNRAFFAQFSPDISVSLYAYAGQIIYGEPVAGVIIDGIQILANSTQFQRAFIERRESTLNEWLFDTEYYISLAELAAQRNYWPQNPRACGRIYEDPDTGKLSYGCPFRPVCASAPEIRQQLLDLNYIQRKRT